MLWDLYGESISEELKRIMLLLDGAFELCFISQVFLLLCKV